MSNWFIGFALMLWFTALGLLILLLAKTGIWWPLAVFLLCCSVRIKYRRYPE